MSGLFGYNGMRNLCKEAQRLYEVESRDRIGRSPWAAAMAAYADPVSVATISTVGSAIPGTSIWVGTPSSSGTIVRSIISSITGPVSTIETSTIIGTSVVRSSSVSTTIGAHSTGPWEGTEAIRVSDKNILNLSVMSLLVVELNMMLMVSVMFAMMSMVAVMMFARRWWWVAVVCERPAGVRACERPAGGSEARTALPLSA